MTQNNTLEVELEESGYRNLGYANSWIGHQSERVKWPQEVLDCSRIHVHNRRTISGQRGIDSMTICDICKIYWKYDSSD